MEKINPQAEFAKIEANLKAKMMEMFGKHMLAQQQQGLDQELAYAQLGSDHELGEMKVQSENDLGQQKLSMSGAKKGGKSTSSDVSSPAPIQLPPITINTGGGSKTLSLKFERDRDGKLLGMTGDSKEIH
jgi:hypothetical protein